MYSMKRLTVWRAKLAGWYPPRKALLAVAVAGGLCFLVPDLYLLGLILLMAGYLLYIRKALTVNLLTGLFLALILFFSANALISFLLWAVHIPFLGLAAGLSNAFLILILPAGRARLPLPRFSGIVIAVTCIASFGFLLAPYLQNKSPATITNLVIQGEDNISHVELTKNVLRHNGLYFSDNPDQEKHIIKNLAGYPQGLHANFALAIRSLMNLDLIGTANRFLVAYYALAAASYALLMGSIVFAALYMYGLTGRTRHISIAGAAVIATGTAGLGATVFLGLFSAGFMTYIWTPILLLLTVALLAAASIQAGAGGRRICVTLAALFCAAMQFTWLFLLPFVVPAFLISLLFIESVPARRVSHRPVYTAAKAHAWAVAVVLVSCLQLPVQFKTTAVKVGVNDPGYIYRIPLSYIILTLCLAAGISLVLWLRHKAWLKVYFVFLALNTAFSLLIYIYQRATIHDLQYYFFKSEYSLLFLTWPLFLAALLLLVGGGARAAKAAGRNGAVGLTVIVLVACAIVYKQLVKPNVDTFWPYRWSLADDLADETVIGGYKQPSPINYIVLGECQRADDYKLSRLSSVLSGDTSSQIRSAYLNILIDQDSTKTDIYNQLDRLAGRQNIRIIDIGNTLPDNTSIRQINLPSAGYSEACSPIL